mgnify:CR=1 FL=1
MIKILEILAFVVSTGAFGYGILCLPRKGTAQYFQLYVCAAGCYMLEELWVIVNSLLGNGGQDGLVTVRLLGFFGCLCFMLSADAGESDRYADTEAGKGTNILALIAPALLLLIYSLYLLSPQRNAPVWADVIGLLSLSPALVASWFSLKHLLLVRAGNPFLEAIRSIDILSLIFFAANYLYPLAYLFCPKEAMGVYDLLLAGILWGILTACRKGAVKCRTSS